MHQKRLNLAVLLLMVLVLSLFHRAASGKTQTFNGKAFDEHGALEYIEQHDITYEGDDVIESRTTYFDLDNRIIGYLYSEYSLLPRFCNYIFRDLRNDYEDGVRIEADRICLFRKETHEMKEETVCLDKEEKQIIGQGFHHFIVSNLDTIANGKIFHVKMVLPSRLDQFGFRILKKTISGNDLLIRLEVDNWFLRLFAPHVDVLYDRARGRLLRYEGISNLTDASGRFKKVQINYVY